MISVARAWVAEGPLSPERTVSIVSQVASGLDAAHHRGLVHRDVKPGNMLLTGEPGHELVYLSDFGVTRHVQGDTRFTETGQFVGTVDYVAPEQIKGELVDHRADVYSLGCVLYECLTGECPFARETGAAVLYAHLQDPPPRPTARRPELPAGIDAVIEKAMAKDPGDRYASAGELAEAAGSCWPRRLRRPRALAPHAPGSRSSPSWPRSC